MEENNLFFIGIVSIVAVVAVVGLLQSGGQNSPIVVQDHQGVTDEPRDSVVGQAGFVETDRDVLRQRFIRQRFIEENERQIQTCIARANNRHDVRTMGSNDIKQDREIQRCVQGIHQDAYISEVSTRSDRYGQMMDVNVCIGGIPHIGEVCSDDIRSGINFITK